MQRLSRTFVIAAALLLTAATTGDAPLSPRGHLHLRRPNAQAPAQALKAPAGQTLVGDAGPTAPVCLNSSGQVVTCHLAMKYFGGHVLANPKVYAIMWKSTVDATTVSSIGPFYKAATNNTFMDWMNEYNTNINVQAGSSSGQAGTNQIIGRGTYAGTITITPSKTSTSITDQDIEDELSAQITAGHIPAPDSNTIYMFHFPAGQSIDQDGTGQYLSCQYWCAYHSTMTIGGKSVFYSVIPDQGHDGCQNGCGSGTAFQNTCASASHELFEAMSDAEVGLATTLGKPIAWYDTETNGQGEVGDMCGQNYDTITDLNDGTTKYTIQQILSHVSNQCVTTRVYANDFNFYMKPNAGTMQQGTTLSIPITTSNTSGTPGNITLAAATLPAGITASFDTNPVAAGSTSNLTLTAASTATIAKDTLVVVTGTASGSGTVPHSASYLLQVTAGTGGGGSNDFSITVPSAAVSVQQGSTGTMTITTATTAGSASTLTFSTGTLPSGVTASFNPTSVTSGQSTTLTLTASASAPVTAATTFTVTASASGGTSHSGTGMVAVTASGGGGSNDFGLSVPSTKAILVMNSSTTMSIGTSVTSGSAQSITLSASGLPSGVTASFSPPSVTAGASSTMTLVASSQLGAIVTQSAAFTVTGTATSGSHSGTGNVQIDGLPTVSISSPTNGSTVSGHVSVNASVLPGSYTTLKLVSFKVDNVELSTATTGTFSYSWDASTLTGTHTLTITATDNDNGATTASNTVTVVAPAGNDFGLSVSPGTGSFTAGSGNAQYTVGTSVQTGSAETITLTATGLPTNVIAQFSPSSLTAGGTSTLTLSAPTGTPRAIGAAFTIKGVSPSVSAGHTVGATVNVHASPAISITTPAAGDISGTVNITAVGAVDADATISSVQLLDGATVLSTGTTATTTYAWDTSTQANGLHQLKAKITDSTGAIGYSAIVSVNIANATSGGDFSLSMSPASASILAGNHATFTITTSPVGTPVTITFAAGTLPSGVTASFNPASVTAGANSTLTLTADSTAPSSTSTILITGTSSANSHSASATLGVTAAGSQPGAPTISITAPTGGTTVSGTVTVTANAAAGSGAALSRVDFFADGILISTATQSPASIQWDTSLLTPGIYGLTAKATDTQGRVGTSTSVSVTVTAANSTTPANGCTQFGGGELAALFGLLALVRRRRS
ncbi:MAG: hypothetical protein JST92_14465 [Deltaproteobacteria bacterium]|nr:hypothetical protein [Deltaproteobacteria bacterium]